MKTSKLEILFKIIWIGLFLITIYVFSWLTFGELIFGNFGTEKFKIWKYIIPNLLTFGILFIYTKELLLGYKPKTKKENIISFVFFFILIIVLISFQLPQFEFLLNDYNPEFWQIILSLIVILTSYFGIIMNRVLKYRKLKNIKTEKITAHNTV